MNKYKSDFTSTWKIIGHYYLYSMRKRLRETSNLPKTIMSQWQNNFVTQFSKLQKIWRKLSRYYSHSVPSFTSSTILYIMRRHLPHPQVYGSLILMSTCLNIFYCMHSSWYVLKPSTKITYAYAPHTDVHLLLSKATKYYSWLSRIYYFQWRLNIT